MAESEKGYFEQYGIEPIDVAKATGFLMLIGFIHTVLLFVFCYFLKPTQFIISHIRIERVQNAFEKVKAKLDEGGGRIAVAFAEGAAIKTLTAPVMLPLKIWAAVKITQMYNAATALEEL